MPKPRMHHNEQSKLTGRDRAHQSIKDQGKKAGILYCCSLTYLHHSAGESARAARHVVSHQMLSLSHFVLRDPWIASSRIILKKNAMMMIQSRGQPVRRFRIGAWPGQLVPDCEYGSQPDRRACATIGIDRKLFEGIRILYRMCTKKICTAFFHQ